MSPSPFVVEWVARVARELDAEQERRRALDVAMGRGRHALVLAGAGFDTFGVDVNVDAVISACAAAQHHGVAIRAISSRHSGERCDPAGSCSTKPSPPRNGR